MKSIIMIFACLVLIVAATSAKDDHLERGNPSDVASLTADERLCIVDVVRKDPSIMAALNSCTKESTGLACIKAIPALASCFA